MKETVTLSSHKNRRIKVFDEETITVLSAIAVISNITALERTLHVGKIERQLKKTWRSELMDKTRVAISVTSQIRARGLSIDPDNFHVGPSDYVPWLKMLESNSPGTFVRRRAGQIAAAEVKGYCD